MVGIFTILIPRWQPLFPSWAGGFASSGPPDFAFSVISIRFYCCSDYVELDVICQLPIWVPAGWTGLKGHLMTYGERLVSGMQLAIVAMLQPFLPGPEVTVVAVC